MEPLQLTPLEARQQEVDQYTTNIAMYQSILATLPTEYPARLEQYKGRTDLHSVVAEIENLDDVELVSQLTYAQQCKASIRAEIGERTKAQAILAVLQAQS